MREIPNGYWFTDFKPTTTVGLKRLFYEPICHLTQRDGLPCFIGGITIEGRIGSSKYRIAGRALRERSDTRG
jgi:hypothetical protein